MNSYDKVPLELKQKRQWLCWRKIDRDGKATKMPVQPDGTPASSTNPQTWCSFKDAVEAAPRYAGIGFVFDASDCYVGIDLDGCRDPQTGKLESWARDIVVQCGTYAEVSPSETGVKLFGSSGEKWPHRNKIDLDLPDKYGKNPGVEVYDAGRFFCVTGKQLKGLPEVIPVDEHFQWLADKIGMRHATTPVDGSGLRLTTPLTERASKYLSKMDAAVSGSSGHNRTFQAACALVMGFGLSEGDAYSLLANEFNSRCDPPWSERELRHKVSQAAKQPGARNYLSDAEPDSWSKIRLPGSYKESQGADGAQEPEESGPNRTTVSKSTALYLSGLASGEEMLTTTGIPELDQAIGGGIADGEMVIVAARPSHGKTAIALQMAHHMSANGLPVVLISEEMTERAIGKRAVQFASEIPEQRWLADIDKVEAELEEHFAKRKEIYIVESCGTIDRTCQEVERSVREQGARVAIIDYAQLLKANGESRYDAISKVSQELRMLATRLNVIVVVLAQLNRGIESRTKFVPVMSDIKETGQLEQDADVIIFGVYPRKINPDADPMDYVIFVAKNRNRAINSSAFHCEFDGARQMLREESITSADNYETAFGMVPVDDRSYRKDLN